MVSYHDFILYHLFGAIPVSRNSPKRRMVMVHVNLAACYASISWIENVCLGSWLLRFLRGDV